MNRIVISVLAIAVVLVMSAMSKVNSHRSKPDENLVQWMSFEEAVQKSKTEKRKIFIDVYTDWCGWCKVMDKNTFSNPTVAKLLNENSMR